MIGEYVDNLKKQTKWIYNETITYQLLKISQSTVKRRLSEFVKIRDKRHGLSSTSPSALKAIIPIFTGPWKRKPPGWGQIDTVAHCGTTLVGDYVFTLTYIDARTFWVGLSAQWNKGKVATQHSMATIKSRLPFKLLAKRDWVWRLSDLMGTSAKLAPSLIALKVNSVAIVYFFSR